MWDGKRDTHDMVGERHPQIDHNKVPFQTDPFHIK